MISLRRIGRIFAGLVVGSVVVGQAPFPTEARAEGSVTARSQIVLRTVGEIPKFARQAKVAPFQILARTAVHGCSADEASYMSRVILGPREDNGVSMRPYMFALPAIVRYLYQFGGCMSPADMAALQDLLSRRIDIFAHETLNITIMLASSMYMLAQYFPDQHWQDADGTRLTSAEVRRRLKELMARRTDKFFKDGYYEQFSPTYAAANIVPLLNLIDFAADPDVRRNATDEAVLELSLLRANSFHGWMIPPITRAHASQEVLGSYSGTTPPLRSVARQILWFYFGASPLVRTELPNQKEPPYVTLAAVSKWRPPAALLNLTEGVTYPYEIETTTPNSSHWDAPTIMEMTGGALVDKSFAVGAGNGSILTSSYNNANQMFGILTEKAGLVRVIDCYHPYWLSNLGEDAWSYDRSSPFQQVYRHGGEGMLLYDIPQRDPFVYGPKNRFFMERNNQADHLFQFAQCRIPADADEVIETQKGIYVRRGSVFVELRALGGKFALDPSPGKGEMAPYRAAKLRGAHVAIYFRVQRTTPGRKLKSFAAEVDAQNIDWNGSVGSFSADDGKQVEVEFSQSTGADGRLRSLPVVSLDGVRQPDTSGYAVRAPFISLRDGVLTLSDPATGATTLQITHR